MRYQRDNLVIHLNFSPKSCYKLIGIEWDFKNQGYCGFIALGIGFFTVVFSASWDEYNRGIK